MRITFLLEGEDKELIFKNISVQIDKTTGEKELIAEFVIAGKAILEAAKKFEDTTIFKHMKERMTVKA